MKEGSSVARSSSLFVFSQLQPLRSMWHTLGKMRLPDVRSEAIGLAVVFLSLPSFISSGCDTAFLTSFFAAISIWEL